MPARPRMNSDNDKATLKDRTARVVMVHKSPARVTPRTVVDLRYHLSGIRQPTSMDRRRMLSSRAAWSTLRLTAIWRTSRVTPTPMHRKAKPNINVSLPKPKPNPEPDILTLRRGPTKSLLALNAECQ